MNCFIYENGCNCRRYNFCRTCGQRCCCCKGEKGDPGPMGPAGPKGEKGDPGEGGQFLSGYIEALGSTQTIAGRGNFVFSITDKVGSDIDLQVPGEIFTITKKGLYYVSWHVNLAEDNVNQAEVGLLQNGDEISGAANSTLSGSFSSGALIDVTSVPYTVALHNEGAEEIKIEDLYRVNGAVSIRIFRFAEGSD